MSAATRPCVGTIPQSDLRGSFLETVGRAWNLLNCWIQRAKERRQLSELDPRLRQDLGLNDARIDRELRKHFWQR